MAFSGNQQLPGLHPVTNGVAGTSPRVREYAVSATYATTIAEGSVAQKDALGANMAAAAGTLTSVNGAAMGVFAHNLAATPGALAKVLIYDDPAQEYVAIQNGTMTAAVAIEAIGQFIGCVSNTYNATLGQSKLMLNTSSLTSVRTTTVYLQVVNAVQPIGETLSSTYGQLTVKIPEGLHIFSSNSTTRITA